MDWNEPNGGTARRIRLITITWKTIRYYRSSP